MAVGSWQLFRAAIITSCSLGVGAALLCVAVALWVDAGYIGLAFYAACVGLLLGLGHGLVAALGGLMARHAAKSDRWTALAAAGAILLAWGAVALLVALGSPAAIAPVAIAGLGATVLTAGSAQVIIRRSNRALFGL